MIFLRMNNFTKYMYANFLYNNFVEYSNFYLKTNFSKKDIKLICSDLFLQKYKIINKIKVGWCQ